VRFDAVKKYRIVFLPFQRLEGCLGSDIKLFYDNYYIKKKSIKICTLAADERKQRSPEGVNALNSNNSLGLIL
jgi:hypothetical protein